MAIDRRVFIAGMSAAAISAGPRTTGAKETSPAAPTDARFAASRRDPNGGYSAGLLNAQGDVIRSVCLPGRGHDATFCKITGRCVVFARRPGNFAVVFTADRHQAPLQFTTPENRHFYGHGVFSRDGRLLYAAENDFDAGRGVIGIYDATDQFRRIGELASHGVGPHDMALLHRSDILVIANGGLKEHPDIGNGRRVLNPDSIETSLVYLDLKTGDLVERHDLPRGTKLSLRHLDVGFEDIVVLGAQAQNPVDHASSLLFRHQRQSRLETIQLPDLIEAELAGYVSSVAFDRSGEIAAFTSSKAGTALLVDIRACRIVQRISSTDLSGIAPMPDSREFRITTGTGDILNADAQTGITARLKTNWSWDNHIAMQIT